MLVAQGVSFEGDPMTVLVTGATGFIGSQVVRELRARGQRVRAAMRPTSRENSHLPPGHGLRRRQVADIRAPGDGFARDMARL